MINIATNILKPLETSSAMGLFARDTGGCLLSRLSLSRTAQERKEVGIAEVSESAIFYFLAPALVKLFSKIYPKITKPEVAKTSQLLSAFGLILPAVYAIAPLKNIATLASSGHDEFTSVVGLKNTDNKPKTEEAKEKTKNIIINSAKIALFSLLASLSLILSCKNETIYNKAQPILSKINKIFDANNGLKLIHYASLIYPVSILGYINSSRDKYEKMENVRRFSVSVPLLLFGDKFIEKPLHKFFDKKFNTSVFENNKIKSYDEILKMKNNKQFLKSKNCAFGLNFLTSTVFVAAGVALLNRIQTKRHFNKDNKENR